MFVATLVALSLLAAGTRFAAAKLGPREVVCPDKHTEAEKASSHALTSLKWRYLAVMLVVRFADWLQGPYFYELYTTKIDSRTGKTFTPGAVSFLFLVGFCSGMVFGTAAGSLTDSFGRCARRRTALHLMAASVGD